MINCVNITIHFVYIDYSKHLAINVLLWESRGCKLILHGTYEEFNSKATKKVQQHYSNKL